MMITKVYNIDEYRIEINADNLGIRFSTDKECPHLHLFFDENGQTVECKDCNKQVTAWWALMAMARGLERQRERIEVERKQLKAEQDRAITHKAAISIEDAWRRRLYLPTCPHCNKPILPQDRFGQSICSKEHYGKSALPLVMKPVLKIVESGKESS